MSELLLSNYLVDILEPVDSPEAHAIFVSGLSIDVLCKFSYENVQSLPYYMAGDVKLGGSPKNTKLLAFDESSYNFVGSCFSEGPSGDFILPVSTSGTCFVVCISDNVNYNHLVAKKVPVTLV